MPLKLGSLFDGIGVFPLAAVNCGITPAWASEIEKAPVSITRRHFPGMKQLGDIMKLNGAELEPVDILTFGSPCQNLSTAGDREGLTGKKSGLFYEAIRIIREMRDATNGIYPAFAVWENVMGAFSSGDRMDFRAVLEAFAGCPVPMPPSEHWASAGMVRGGESDISWRLLDAQYWGSPRLQQRRKRIFLVADFRGKRSAQVLFKCRPVLPDSKVCGQSGPPSAGESGIFSEETGRHIPVILPIQERQMRGAVKEKDEAKFLTSLGRPDEPFPTLLASSANSFSFWYEGEDWRKEGGIRYLTPLECERLQGLPDHWTAYGCKGETISDSARYRALGNSIALPCAEYVMAGICEVCKSD